MYKLVAYKYIHIYEMIHIILLFLTFTMT